MKLLYKMMLLVLLTIAGLEVVYHFIIPEFGQHYGNYIAILVGVTFGMVYNRKKLQMALAMKGRD